MAKVCHLETQKGGNVANIPYQSLAKKYFFKVTIRVYNVAL